MSEVIRWLHRGRHMVGPLLQPASEFATSPADCGRSRALSGAGRRAQQLPDYFVAYPQQDYPIYAEYGLLAIRAAEEDRSPTAPAATASRSPRRASPTRCQASASSTSPIFQPLPELWPPTRQCSTLAVRRLPLPGARAWRLINSFAPTCTSLNAWHTMTDGQSAADGAAAISVTSAALNTPRALWVF